MLYVSLYFLKKTQLLAPMEFILFLYVYFEYGNLQNLMKYKLVVFVR